MNNKSNGYFLFKKVKQHELRKYRGNNLYFITGTCGN